MKKENLLKTYFYNMALEVVLEEIDQEPSTDEVKEKAVAVPVGILKTMSSYETVLNEVDDQEVIEETSQSKRKKRNKDTRNTETKQVVPVWYLFRFAQPFDIFMIIVGSLMATVAGIIVPSSLLLLGGVIDNFISYDIGQQLLTTNTTSTVLDNQTYFCNVSTDDSSSNIQRYLLSQDSKKELQQTIALYSYYYIGLGTGLFLSIFIANMFWNFSAYRQTRRMRLAFFHSIMYQNIGWFDVNSSAELNSRLADDIEKIQAGIGDKLAIFIENFSSFLTGFVIAFITNWKLALVVGILLPILSFLAAATAKIIATFTVREQNSYASAGAVAEEVLSSIKTVVAFGGEHKEIDRYITKLKKAKSEGLKKAFFMSCITGIFNFIFISVFALGFWYGAILIGNCELGPGDVVIVLFSIVTGSNALGNALPELETFALALGSATAVFAIIDKQSEIDASSNDGEKLEVLEGNIEFKDVIFNYPARPDVQVLNGLDLTIRTGQTVALVGPSGCGKSTVVQLLQRFYNPLGGLITVDGHDINSLNLKWLRSNIGVVSQEPVLFDTTIGENIRYGREDATMADIEAAAIAANAHNFISELPDGYNTLVGEKGTQLSGGQKQRIAIARALVRDPKILLLDEATSALDTESEKIVQEALDKARKGRTTIVIAHRLSTIQTADVIVSIENGHVVEMGTHEDLMKNQGLYYELVTAQTIEEEEEKRTDSLSEFKVAVRRGSRRSLRRQQTRQSIISQRRDSLYQRRSSSQSIKLDRKISMQSINSDVFSVFTRQFSNFSLSDIPVIEDSPLPSPNLDKTVQFDDENLSKEIKMKDIETDEDPLVQVKFKELLKLNKPDWYLVIPGIIFTGIQGVVYVVLAVLFSELINVYGSTDKDDLLSNASVYALILLALAIFDCIVQFTAVITLGFAGDRLTERLRTHMFQAMLRQDMSWFDRRSNSTGALTTRLANDASEIQGVTGIKLGYILQLVFGLIVSIIVAFEASWLLSIVFLMSFPLIFLGTFIQFRSIRGRSIKNKELLVESGKTATEAIDNIRTVASLGAEDKFYNHYSELLKTPFISNMKGVFFHALIYAISQGSGYYIYAAGFSLGAYLVISDPSTIYHSSYQEVLRTYYAIIFTSFFIGRATSFAPDAQKAKLSASRIFTLVNRCPNIDNYSQDGEKLDKTNGFVEVKNVHFSYPARPDVPVLQGLNVNVKPGETLALVGPSGCGKSTVVSLIERFYDPMGGNLSLESHDLRDLNIRWLRSQIGIVSQEPVLFDTSIADNIRYGANFREVSDEEIIEAAKAANIHNFIETLPQGYATNVGSKGTQLSGGQKQRVAIARALVQDPKILLLDEATSALDTESEKIVQEALDKAREGRTSIVIAHRLSTIYNSNCIAVIHNGSVIEQGTHLELMRLKGAYHHLNIVQKKEEQK